MSSNLFVRLKQILPDAPVLLGRVVEHNADATSTIELPLGLTPFGYSGGLVSGGRIRARGTTVPVGSNAFVRNGVVETQAPDGDPIEHVIGEVIETPVILEFVGEIPNITAIAGSQVAFDVSSFWDGGIGDIEYSVASGELPWWAVLDGSVIRGTASMGDVVELSLQARDVVASIARSNVFKITIAAEALIGVLASTTFDYNDLRNEGTLPGPFTVVGGEIERVAPWDDEALHLRLSTSGGSAATLLPPPIPTGSYFSQETNVRTMLRVKVLDPGSGADGRAVGYLMTPQILARSYLVIRAEGTSTLYLEAVSIEEGETVTQRIWTFAVGQQVSIRITRTVFPGAITTSFYINGEFAHSSSTGDIEMPTLIAIDDLGGFWLTSSESAPPAAGGSETSKVVVVDDYEVSLSSIIA
ncbi:hypothetical protein [Rubrivivax sp. JA1026]|uniref:hypothetical protein n=1 Tax=Rubrivivax sp. JA1026 TaxID=2710888 RepID=UPI00197D77BF|nr:hypothetical protein [Rubrivivax sp. JA1026]